MTIFSDLALHKNVLQAIHDMGFEEPSPIQAACIPKILEGGDLIGQAQTGTGKTAAFGIPLAEALNPTNNRIQAIVLTPTRELAIQVAGELVRICKYKKIRTLPIYGGQSISHQIRALRQGVHVVIGTPGRVLDHLRRKTLHLENVKMLVLDEADEMLDMGFIEDIETILSHMKAERQTLLFSATMPPEIKRLAHRYMKNPEIVAVSREEVTAPSIEQVYYKVFERNKRESLCRILDSQDVELGIIFCRTKRGVDELSEALQARGYLADGLHGDLSQAQRDKVMKAFREGTIEFLIATDVAARGIDVGNVSHVINYDIPQDPESYVHRIGRTGRAGRKGIAMTLVTPREMRQLMVIQKQTKASLVTRTVPTLEEIAERKRTQLREQLRSLIVSDSTNSMYQEIVEELMQEHEPAKVAAAALHLAFHTDPSGNDEEEGYNFGETGAARGMVRFFLNVGRNVNMKPQDLVREISESVGIPGKSVGRIDIFENFTFVEVPEDVAPFVYEALRQTRINGKRINLEPAKPRTRKS
ncbi:DEAD/DEAH box helicase [Brevibacillus laterosporus]|uniref:DEAD/DEAH box helicase n=1 Tax=Brevibacillus laterosporus TaxID=1465 RepID=UPI0018F87D03|nr:DEAD/DEAH box helicase [Brevibacillus laterosporus]MBG9775452.1 RNA helicase [Brevibacillus laterosporus]